MIPHDHEDITQVVIACPACIERVRAQEVVERWAQAPVREVTWTCSYDLPDSDDNGPPESLTFTREVGVPHDLANVWELDERYADVTGEAFVMALPESVPMDHTTDACETMEVESITVGRIVVAVDQPVPDDQPSLFE